ncbi:hypothetical protein [Microbulbifer sp. GL-2]|uniref:hypothetical protein n=1 Tax=Microbulbifer sp. GL-2 TaxID=2591606 RepID=UPI001162A6DB|nr:hypothetical protein [Microbulbifer sp. GL-2]BBM02393.1 hypothetical protein GL2_24670 [Microbulbifer sp. GL-2]
MYKKLLTEGSGDMSEILRKGKYTTVGPEDIWKVYNEIHGIFRGSGNTTTPKIDKMRPSDLTVVTNPETGEKMVIPDGTKGISFADSIDSLATKKVEGQVWIIPNGKKIPDGLVFNIKDIDHPLLNVSEPISEDSFRGLIADLVKIMEPCGVKIAKGGKVVGQYLGSMPKVVNNG